MVWWSQYASCEPYEHVQPISYPILSSSPLFSYTTCIPWSLASTTWALTRRLLGLVLNYFWFFLWSSEMDASGCDQEGMIPERVLVKKVHQASITPTPTALITCKQHTRRDMYVIHPSIHPSIYPCFQIIYNKLLIRWNGEELMRWWDDNLLLLRCCVVEVCTYIPHTLSPSLTVSSLQLVLSLYSTSSSPLSL